MKTISIYEPAMCCPTGLCGVGIDPELLRISTVLDTLEKEGIKINRYNLTSFPNEFIKNTEINQLLNDEGVDILPIVLFDGKIVITKRYPTNGEFVQLLEIPSQVLAQGSASGANSSAESCC